ncbi:MAG: alpha/beta hydrolase [Ignavibacteriaceae bacterium]|nr:alpha/beta hydrolase [Ignavibacteriaceae bacterium]
MKIKGLDVSVSGNEKNDAMIFVHGFIFDKSMWEKQIEHFSENYYCISYDIRGLGKSETGSGQYTMEGFVDDFFEVVKELKIKKAIAVGLSMGGYILFRAYERQPALFRTLILCDTRPSADSNEAKLKRAAGISLIDAGKLDDYVSVLMNSVFGEKYKEKNKKGFEDIVALAKSFSPEGIKGSLLAMMGRTSSVENLDKIEVPVLLVVGENDTVTPVSEIEAFAEKIKRKTVSVIPAAGHLSPLEEPVIVNRVISNFIHNNL